MQCLRSSYQECRYISLRRGPPDERERQDGRQARPVSSRHRRAFAAGKRRTIRSPESSLVSSYDPGEGRKQEGRLRDQVRNKARATESASRHSTLPMPHPRQDSPRPPSAGPAPPHRGKRTERERPRHAMPSEHEHARYSSILDMGAPRWWHSTVVAMHRDSLEWCYASTAGWGACWSATNDV